MWQTRAERTGYEETARYDEVVAFCRRLAAASPEADFTSFGQSGEGRDLPLLILSRDRAFTPQAARATGRLVVLIQNGIHAGEIEGKDASLELARDILITGRRRDLLNEVILLIIPIFNTDGHERFGPYSRINQNGPKEMGWRVTATNLNLNRDYMKADAVEMRAWLQLWVAWQPDLYFDNHTTDGSDHQYDLLYAAATQADTAEPIAAWTRETLLPAVLPALAADGHLTLPYGGPRDPQDLSRGIYAPGAFSPRLSNGYGALCNRPSILVETHALKPYAVRVRGTYNIMLHTLRELNRHPDALRDAIRKADAQAERTRGGDVDERVPLRFGLSDRGEPIVYRGYEHTVRPSPVTGGGVIQYSSRPVDVPTQLYCQVQVEAAVAPPAAYLVPPQWHAVIDRLELHGIEFFRLRRRAQIEVESYRFEDVAFAAAPYEGRQIPRYKTVPTREKRDFVAGTVVVPLAQSRAKLAVHLLEPEAPDSLVAWGFFNAVFEQKEYAEDYVLEPIARQMLAEDATLAREFEGRLRSDEQFAQSPEHRLDFCYRRSPYWDRTLNVYPVARLMDDAALERLTQRVAPDRNDSAP